MKDVCEAMKKKLDHPQVRHYGSPHLYTSSSIFLHSTGGPSSMDEARINVRMEDYKDLRKDQQMPRNVTYFWNRMGLYVILILPALKMS